MAIQVTLDCFGQFGPFWATFDHVGPKKSARPTFFRTFHQLDFRAYHFLATAPWKPWPPMWRWELPLISLIFSPAFRLMSTTTPICHNHPNRWLEKRCKIFQWEREKTVYNVWNIQLEMLRSGIFCKDDNFSTLHQPWQATWLQLRGWVKKTSEISKRKFHLMLNKDWTKFCFQVAVEFCEDAAYNGLLYVESRFCPNFLVGDSGSVCWCQAQFNL